MTYYYPDDVIIETINGKRTARIGYDVSMTRDGDNGWALTFRSEMPADMELGLIQATFKKAWLKGREDYRNRKRDEYMQRAYPKYHAEKMARLAEIDADKAWELDMIAKGILVNTPEYRAAQKARSDKQIAG